MVLDKSDLLFSTLKLKLRQLEQKFTEAVNFLIKAALVVFDQKAKYEVGKLKDTAYIASSKARGWNPTGFYPTPHSVVESMVRMTMHDAGRDGRDPRRLSDCDPCVGSGRMLLHGSNHSLRLYGQDVDLLAVAMCKINGALYAPWLVFPLPASILGTDVEPPPASLPVPEPPPEGVRIYRVDDHGQGLLFDL
jgi:hypothetical protein